MLPLPPNHPQITLSRISLVLTMLPIGSRTESKGRVVLNRFFANPELRHLPMPRLYGSPAALAHVHATHDKPDAGAEDRAKPATQRPVKPREADGLQLVVAGSEQGHAGEIEVEEVVRKAKKGGSKGRKRSM